MDMDEFCCLYIVIDKVSSLILMLYGKVALCCVWHIDSVRLYNLYRSGLHLGGGRGGVGLPPPRNTTAPLDPFSGCSPVGSRGLLIIMVVWLSSARTG